jgi:hypothetical protein
METMDYDWYPDCWFVYIAMGRPAGEDAMSALLPPIVVLPPRCYQMDWDPIIHRQQIVSQASLLQDWLRVAVCIRISILFISFCSCISKFFTTYGGD